MTPPLPPHKFRMAKAGMKRGHCLECGSEYDAPQIEDGLCPRCQKLEPQNLPLPMVDGERVLWKFSKTAMRERLGVTGDRDE